MKLEFTDYKHLSWGPFSALTVTFATFIVGQILGYLLFLFGLGVYFATAATLRTGIFHTSWGDLLFTFRNTIDSYVNSTSTDVIGPSVAIFLFQIFCIEAVILALLFWFLRARKAKLADIGLKKPALRDVGYALLGFVGYFVLYIGVVTVLTKLFPSLDTSQEQELGVSTNLAGSGLVLVFIGLVVLPPLVEEIIARGFLFSGLRKSMKFLPAALVTSFLFGLAHFWGGKGGSAIWIASVDTFMLSMVLVYLRERTGSLWASIGLHSLKNFVAFFFLFILKV